MKTGKTVIIEPPAPNEDKLEIRDAVGRTVTQRKTEVRLGVKFRRASDSSCAPCMTKSVRARRSISPTWFAG